MDHDISISVKSQSIGVNISGGSNLPAPGAENDFIVANTGLNWIKKTLVEIRIILGLGSAAYTDSTDYAVSDHAHDEDYEPAISMDGTELIPIIQIGVNKTATHNLLFTKISQTAIDSLRARYVHPVFAGTLVIGNGGKKLTASPPNPLTPPGSDGTQNAMYNTFFGHNAGLENLSGSLNTFIGSSAGRDCTIGDQNTFVGVLAGILTTTGYHNTYVGAGAGQHMTVGSSNAYFGCDSGLTIASGGSNAFFGCDSGALGATGSRNTFIGQGAGRSNTADDNCFFGQGAGWDNTSGTYNNFIGKGTGNKNTTGFQNCFFGTTAGTANLTGAANVYIGFSSGASATGSSNVFIGDRAAYSLVAGAYNAMLGRDVGRTLTSGSDNVFIGGNAGYNASQKINPTNTIAIGKNTYTTADNQTVIGNVSMAEVYLGSTTGAAKLICSKPKFTAIPVAADGLSSGDVWSNGGILTIVS